MAAGRSKSIVFRSSTDFINEVDCLARANLMDRTDYILAACVKLVEFYESHGLLDKDADIISALQAENNEQLALPSFLYSEELSEDEDDYSLEAAEDDDLPWGFR